MVLDAMCVCLWDRDELNPAYGKWIGLWCLHCCKSSNITLMWGCSNGLFLSRALFLDLQFGGTLVKKWGFTFNYLNHFWLCASICYKRQCLASLTLLMCLHADPTCIGLSLERRSWLVVLTGSQRQWAAPLPGAPPPCHPLPCHLPPCPCHTWWENTHANTPTHKHSLTHTH